MHFSPGLKHLAYVFVHLFVHSLIHTPKRHDLARNMILWVLFQPLYDLLNTKKLLCVSHSPRAHESKDDPV